DALTQFHAFVSSEDRALLLQIVDESVQVSQTIHSTETLDQTLNQLSSTIDDKSAYYLILKTSPRLAFVAYIADHAPTRTKMVYAATTPQLLHDLGGKELFSINVFMSQPDELTPQGWRDAMASLNQDAPLTSEERHLKELQVGQLANGGQVHNPSNSNLYGSTGTSGAGLSSHAPKNIPVQPEAVDALDNFASKKPGQSHDETNADKYDAVVLGIDLSTELIYLRACLTDVTLDDLANDKSNADSPQYTLLQNNSTVYFAYTCPPETLIRSKMIYASNKHGLVTMIKDKGIDITRVLEADNLAEIRDDLNSEMTQARAMADNPPGISSSRLRFAKPRGPGRR
ncbi:hypothetical protein NADFUDRAFT_45052, partial [Nadsonia fulvescens var. elongata DSM 6958]